MVWVELVWVELGFRVSGFWVRVRVGEGNRTQAAPPVNSKLRPCAEPVCFLQFTLAKFKQPHPTSPQMVNLNPRLWIQLGLISVCGITTK